MYVGYARVSTTDQNLHMQLDALTQAGCIQIFEEKISGRNKARPELEAMLQMLRKGDTVVIYKLDRIGRSMKHVLELAEHFEKEGINLISLKENIDTSTAAGRFFFHLCASFAEFERDMIIERTRNGLEAARARGRKGGRPKKDEKDVNRAIKLYESKQYSLKEIQKMTGVSSSTIYRKINEKSGV